MTAFSQSLKALRATLATLPPALTGPIAQSAAATGAIRTLNAVLGFAVAVLLAKWLGAEGYGVFAFGVGAVTLAASVARLGFPDFLVRMIPTFVVRQDWPRLNGVLRTSIISTTAICCLAMLLAVAGLSFTSTGEPGGLSQAVLLATAAVPAISFCALSQGALRGLKKTARAYAPEFIIVQCVMLAGLAALAMSGRLTPITALACFAGAWMAAAFAGWRWTLNAWPQEARKVRAATKDARIWLATVAVMSVGALTGLLAGRVELFVLGGYFGPAEVGVYAIAFRFAQFVTLPGFALSSGFAPALSGHDAAGEQHAIARKVSLGARAATLSAALAAIAISMFAWLVLPMIDTAFHQARLPAIILCAGYVLQAAMGRPSEILNMLGHSSVVMWGCLFGALLHLTLLLPFAVAFGPTGAAIATAVSLVFTSFILSVALWRKTGLTCIAFAGGHTFRNRRQ